MNSLSLLRRTVSHILPRSVLKEIRAPLISYSQPRTFHTAIHEIDPLSNLKLEPPWFSKFRDLNEVNSFMGLLSCSHQNVADLRLGWFTNSHPLRGIKIHSHPTSGDNPQIILLGGRNSREWATTSVGLYVASVLSRQSFYGVDISIFPVMNPENYHMSTNSPKSTEDLEMSEPLGLFQNQRNQPQIDEYQLESDLLRGHLGKKFIRLQQDLSGEGVFLKDEPGKNKDQDCIFDMAHFGGRRPSPTSYIIELRDQGGLVEEAQIIAKGKEVLSVIHHLINSQ